MGDYNLATIRSFVDSGSISFGREKVCDTIRPFAGDVGSGDRIYFAVYRQISDYSDHTEVAWTITLTDGSARTAYTPGAEPATGTGQAVRVAPNPGNDLIRLSGVGQRGTVRGYDALGRLQVLQSFTSREGRVELPAGALPPGPYYLSVQSDGQLSRHKWLKQ